MGRAKIIVMSMVLLLIIGVGGCDNSLTLFKEKEILITKFDMKSKSKKTYKQKNDNVELTVNEIQDIINENLTGLESRFYDLQAEYYWNEEAWREDPSVDQQAHEQATNIIKEKISDLVTEEWMEENVAEFLIAYWCECDVYYLVTHDMLDHRFQILEQTNDHIKVSFIKLEDPLSYGGTRILNYVHTDDTWKLAEQEWLTTDEKTLDLTFEDLKLYYDIDMKLVEEINHEDEDYLVVEDESGYHFAINVRDSSVNHKLTEKHNNKIQE